MTLRPLIAVILLATSLAANAEDPEGLDDSVTGTSLPPIQVAVVVEPAPAHAGSPVSRGAAGFGVDEAYFARCKEAVELLYRRDYKDAKAAFIALDEGDGLGAAGAALVWQALMIENFDFRYESQYTVSYRQARSQLEAAIQRPGRDAWENFLLGGILGVDAIHTLRKGDYLVALNRGYDAMRAIDRARALAPTVVDLQLADGIYNYWRSAVTMSSRLLPDFGDHRVEGIAAMTRVERDGVVLGPAATMALTFTWMEENDDKRALAAALRNRAAYPDNVINNLLLGRIYLSMRRYPQAEASLLDVLRVAPDNQRVHAYLARVYTRERRYDDALAALDTYLAYPDLSDSFRAEGYHLRGDVYYRQQDWARAEAAYGQAWTLGKLKRSRIRMDMARDRQKRG